MSNANDPQVHEDVVAALAPGGPNPARIRTFGAGLGGLASAIPAAAVGAGLQLVVHLLLRYRASWHAIVPTLHALVVQEVPDPADQQALADVAGEIFGAASGGTSAPGTI